MINVSQLRQERQASFLIRTEQKIIKANLRGKNQLDIYSANIHDLEKLKDVLRLEGYKTNDIRELGQCPLEYRMLVEWD